MVLKSFWVKSQNSAHRQLTDYEKMDPDDILWLMQSKRKRCSCKHSIPSPRRGTDTGSCCFGALQGQARCFPTHCQKKAICREQVLQTGALATVLCHSAAADK